MNANSIFCVYIIYSEKLNRYYIGTTDAFERRLAEHNDGLRKDAFTFDGIPWKKVLVIGDLSSSAAYQLERYLKKTKSKQYILNLLKYPELVLKLKNKFS